MNASEGLAGTATTIVSPPRDLDEIRLRFEMVFAKLSSRFVNLPVEQVDQEIESALAEVCEALGFELSGLWQMEKEEGDVLRLTHLFSPPYGPKRPDRLVAGESFPWVFAEMMKGDGRPIILAQGKMPPEAARDEESQRFYGARTSLVLPLSVGGGSLFGVLTFDMIRGDCDWPDELVQRLHVVAQVVASALPRRNTEMALRRSEERFNLATEAAGAGVWELDCTTRVFWASAQSREIFEYRPKEVISMIRFEESVVPEDLPIVRSSLRAALEQGEPISTEYRIRLRNGGLRWLASHGRAFFSPDGAPERLLGVTIDITNRKRVEAELRVSLEEIERLKDKIESERDYLASEVTLAARHGSVVGRSRAIEEVLRQVEKVAATDSTVLINGETGTGKELIANEIHRLSPRRDRLLIKVNCAALPTALVESELFGREKGAFTGALTRQVGRFELADKGTIFLDEVGELPPEVQVKLLRVLQNGEFERLGSPKTIKVDVRVIAATNRDLPEEARNGRFRQDLLYRLNVFPLRVPPLRERTEDIPLLVWEFVAEFSSRMGKKITQVSRSTMERLQQRSWPGNIRELRNAIEYAAILSTGDVLAVPDAGEPAQDGPALTLADCERRHILATLERTNGRIKGPRGAAKLLGLPPSTLYGRMESLGIPKSRERL